MKKTYHKLFAALFLMVVIIGCTDQNTVKNHKGPIRLKIVESTFLNGVDYAIISVDGNEYISTSRGGICPLKTE